MPEIRNTAPFPPSGPLRGDALARWRAQEEAGCLSPAAVLLEPQALPSGWWILPAAVAGAAAWTWLAILIL